MRVLITGVAGFIGSHLAERLLATGATVIGVDSFSDYYEPALKRRNVGAASAASRFALVEGDLGELGLAELVDEVDVIFHLAGRPGVRRGFGLEFDEYVRDNLVATQRLLEAAARTRLDRLVFASSSSVYGAAERYPTAETDRLRPVSPYGITKLAAEELCRLYWQRFGVPAVCLRLFTVYGPRCRPDAAFARFIDAALGDRPLVIHGDGRQSRDFTFVGDAVDAAVRAAERGTPGATYNVAGGSPASLLDALSLISDLLGASLEAEHDPAGETGPPRTAADLGAARRDLGFAPSTALREGLARQIESQRASSRVPA